MTSPFLLYLDAAEGVQSVGLSAGAHWLGHWQSSGQKQEAHALHTLVETALAANRHSLAQVDAIVVNNGPGSYTGLRIGLATAKGLCYALGKPLILLNHLELIAHQLFQRCSEAQLAVALVDARRMDAFAAAYDRSGQIVMQPQAVTLVAEQFIHMAGGKLTVFGGSGAAKLKPFISGSQFLFDEAILAPNAMMAMALAYFSKKQFADLSLSSPFYFKAFYTPPKK